MLTRLENYMQSRIIRKRLGEGRGLLSDRENIFLLRRAKHGNRIALDHLVYFYEPLLRKLVIRHIQPSHPDFMDKMQFARIRFIYYAQVFDEKRGVKFTTFVSDYLGRDLATECNTPSHLIRKPIEHFKKWREAKIMKKDFLRWHGRYPTEEELAEITGLSIEQLQQQRNLFAGEISFERPLGEKLTLKERLADMSVKPPDSRVPQAVIKETLDQAIEGSGLNPREKYILREYYFSGKTLRTLADEMNVSRMRISQIRDTALGKIRRRKSRILKELLN